MDFFHIAFVLHTTWNDDYSRLVTHCYQCYCESAYAQLLTVHYPYSAPDFKKCNRVTIPYFWHLMGTLPIA